MSEQRTQIFDAQDDVIHVVTAEDVATKRFHVRDVVLPVIGDKGQVPLAFNQARIYRASRK